MKKFIALLDYTFQVNGGEYYKPCVKRYVKIVEAESISDAQRVFSEITPNSIDENGFVRLEWARENIDYCITDDIELSFIEI